MKRPQPVRWFIGHPLTGLAFGIAAIVTFFTVILPVTMLVILPVAIGVAAAMWHWLGVGWGVILFAIAVLWLRWHQRPLDPGSVSPEHAHRLGIIFDMKRDPGAGEGD